MSRHDSKELSYYLRHAPEKINITLDKQGWTDIDKLIRRRTEAYHSPGDTVWTRELLEQIVAEDNKGRYTIEGNKIRANQGHSVSSVKIDFNQAIPPVILYHGTSRAVVGAIYKKGLLPMNRHHVHLSDNVTTAALVADRHARVIEKRVIFQVDAKKMFADGIKFFLSDNGVWLVDHVDPKYLILLE